MVSYICGFLIERRNKKRYNIVCFIWSVILILFPLFLFKYYNFFVSFVSAVSRFVGLEVGLPGLNYVMPLGISFYTLQAIGYMYDVYNKKIHAETNFLDYMLFVCFFPQIVCGPISRAEDLLPQIKKRRKFSELQTVMGLRYLLWGLFLQVVVADRLGITVKYVLDSYQWQSGLFCWIASIFYTFQIYCDFAGYSLMAVGVGKVFGFELINNFKRPYFSLSITDFWHRWHISLSSWLRDYVYIPLGGSHCSKRRNYLNIVITFLVSGLWHGANITFIVWGGLHGLFQVIEKYFGLNSLNPTGYGKFARIVSTFLLVNLLWLFFYMPSIEDAICILKKMTIDFSVGIDVAIPTILWNFVLIACVLFNDFNEEYSTNRTLIYNKNPIFRWGGYLLFVFLILFAGVFDAGQFIYESF